MPSDLFLAILETGVVVHPAVDQAVGAGDPLSVGGGYADPVPRARPGPRFECTRGVSGEIGSAPLVATSEAGLVVDRFVVAAVEPEDLQFH